MMQADSGATRILMLHRVLEDAPAAFGLPGCYRMRGTALTVAELERVLEDAAPIVPLQEIEQALETGATPPPGCVLTFDDGYREHLDVVAPLLAARGLSATFYVATGLHGSAEAVAVVDAWYWLLDHTRQTHVTLALPEGGRFQGRLDTLAGKAEWVGGAPKAALLAATPGQQQAMLRALAEAVDRELPADLAQRLYLRPEEWDTLREYGMQIGAHSVTHPRLSQLSVEEIEREVGSSLARLRGQGLRVPFAYPDGAYDSRVLEVVRCAGVSSAVTCEPGAVVPSTKRLQIPRVFVQPSSLSSVFVRSPS